MRLYERDWPGEFNLKNNFSNSAYNEFFDKLENDYPELVPYFKDEDDYGYGSWFYEKAFNFYKENKDEMNWENMDEFVKEFLETEGKSLIQSLNNDKKRNDKFRAARKTGKVDGKKVWHWEYEDDPDDGTRHRYKVDGVDPDDGTYDGVYESTKLNIKEAKEYLTSLGYSVEQDEEAINYISSFLKNSKSFGDYDIEVEETKVGMEAQIKLSNDIGRDKRVIKLLLTKAGTIKSVSAHFGNVLIPHTALEFVLKNKNLFAELLSIDNVNDLEQEYQDKI